MKTSSHASPFLIQSITALILLIPLTASSQNGLDAMQFARVTGIGASRYGSVGDSLNNSRTVSAILLYKRQNERTNSAPQEVGAVFLVTNTNDTGSGSFRRAITDANANPGPDFIHFGIPPDGPKTIALLSKLPNIVDAVTIDGTTQPGYVDKPMIELNCASIGPFQALDLFSTSTVRGLVINRLTGGTGIVLWEGSGGSIVEGNFFGTNLTGTIRVGNVFNGVISRSPNNRIGGTALGSKNVFSGQGNPSVALITGANGNVIQGNFIGTDVTGTVRLGNTEDGILIISGARDDTIGGTAPEARNVISGSDNFSGIAIVGTGASGTRGIQVMGNYIGTDVTGMVRFNNGGNGIFIRSSPNNVIGGTNAAARNVISGNTNPGIFFDLSGATNNTVQGNFIGTKANGTDILGNSKGVVMNSAPNNIIGGAAVGAGNVISGNSLFGVEIRNSGATGNKVEHNFIGTNTAISAVASLNLGNGSYGVVVNASQNTIGGLDTSKGNIIAYNRAAGVYDSSGTGNVIRMNRIFSNTNGLGIDLLPKGVTPNDSLDGDTGSNNRQNFPLLDSARVVGVNTTVYGLLNSIPNATFAVDFYMNTACDSSHFGEGETYLGSQTVTCNDSGKGYIVATLPVVVSTSSFLTATATDSAGNTSEFSQCLCLSDSDADGLTDSWETQGWGLDVNSDAVIDLDLYALGARAQHKDLFVEVDAMAGMAPKDTTLQRVANAFAAVPNSFVNNPDGTNGINLHIQLDDTTLGLFSWSTNWWTLFHDVKKDTFGTQAQRASPNARYILDAKKLVYRYCIFAYSHDTDGSSGQAEENFPQGCNDFMVTLGTWTVPGGTADQKAGTFMHELGHTLGLHHGGQDDINYKPNYISIMNYTWQTPFRWADTWRLNYSPAALPTLIESQLNENLGLNPAPGAYPIISIPFSGPGRVKKNAHLKPSTAADWDTSGSITSPVNVDLNVFRSTLDPSPSETLYSYVDWSNLIYNFRNSPDFNDLPPTGPLVEMKEMTLDDFNELDNLPPPKPIGHFIMDGELDPSAILLTSNGGINLHGRYISGQLYVATNSAQSQAADMFIFISDAQNALRSAPSGKTGQVAAWTVFLGNESTDNSSGWSNVTEAPLTNITVDTAGTVLEGVIDIELLYGRVPTELFIAVGKYGTNVGGALLAQVPVGNGDGNIDPAELFPFTDAVLPIQLASFTAQVVTGLGVRLDWLTISEINNYGFEVQRKSETQQGFLSLPHSFIPGNGTTNEPHSYSFMDTTVVAGQWSYRLKQIDLDGTIHYGPEVTVDVLTGLQDNSLPEVFALYQNYPNPFNPSTTVRFDVPVTAQISLKVFNVLGQEVAVIMNEVKSAGKYRVEWNATGLASGVYLCRIQAGSYIATNKLLLIR